MISRQKKALQSIISSKVKFDCSLKQYTSFNIGGPAAALVQVENEAELLQLLRFTEEQEIEWQIIGRGTNILVRDAGYPGIIVLLGGDFKKFHIKKSEIGETSTVTVGAGYSLVKLSARCSEEGLEGLEFAVGIPGTVGGAVVMNAGAWGAEISDVLESVTVVTGAGAYDVTGEELDFTYRSWPGFEKFKTKGAVTEVTLQLSKADPQKIQDRCRELVEKRRLHQPITYPNAGSFFKNPPDKSAGYLIDRCGLKGVKVGGAEVSALHANFFINTGEATASDMFTLMQLVQQEVNKKYGISLEPEVHFI